MIWVLLYHHPLNCSFHRYGRDLRCKKQPLIRGRGVSHCKNLLSPRFESVEGIQKLNIIHLFVALRVLFCIFLVIIGFSFCCMILNNAANNTEEGQDKTYYVMLPPELCVVHPLPGPLVRSAQCGPNI